MTVDLWLLGLNAVAGLGAALVWFVYLALSVRERRWGWALLTGTMAGVAGFIGVMYFMAVLDPEVEGHLRDYLRPVVALGVGLPAVIAYGFLVEGNRITERALKQIKDGLPRDASRGDDAT